MNSASADASPPDPADVQQEVAAARAAVLRGRGPGAAKDELLQCQHQRALLGDLPTPLARELVHLSTEAIRSTGQQPQSISDDLRQLRAIWSTDVGQHAAAVAGEWQPNPRSSLPRRPVLPTPPDRSAHRPRPRLGHTLLAWLSRRRRS
ncbi:MULTISPECIES: hypothetical protein [Nocardia]|jgi:hypothetical protein|uniref:DUF222 domain-containing protein n=1 Tax=Nocardia elegans TaxID=300029 RepID=A0ABW6TPL6_9NOCA|nr:MULTISPECIES: hypothetical protein [Nocardia]